MKKIQPLLLILATTLLISSCTQKPKDEASSQTEKTSSVSLTSDSDPVCNMNIKGVQADTTLHNGKIYGFCSDDCKKAFKGDPEKYLAKK